MYVSVRLFNGFEKTLLYYIPQELVQHDLIGKVVKVPLRNQWVPALVTQLLTDVPQGTTFEVKSIRSIEPFPADERYKSFMEKVARFYYLDSMHFYQRVQRFLKDEKPVDVFDEEMRDSRAFQHVITLTEQQLAVVEHVEQFITNAAFAPTLLHGVTGAGKTEVYKQLISYCVHAKKTALLLLPEVSLAMQFEQKLKSQLPHIQIFGFHSATKITERRTLWHALVTGQPVLIVGVHLPVVLPIANLGLIVVDEEHAHSFWEKKHPKINSKDIALWRAKEYGIPILLGSATPAVSSLYQVQQGKWKFFQITKRFVGKFPTIQKVVLTAEKPRRASFWVSEVLVTALKECLARKEQAIIYINRRGYSFFVQCKQCGFIFQCPACSVSLTLHQENNVRNDAALLRCHYCDYRNTLAVHCPECKASSAQFLKKGIGTQQAVQLFQQLFPEAKIERADLDSTSKKRAWHETVKKFEQGKIDILIGTQLITKGYHFPRVTLVGILWADINLHFPIFNASEIALQQLIQVAGRAGRAELESKVVAQVMRDHPIFDYLDEKRYIEFCSKELALRREVEYPPFLRLVQLELRNNNAVRLDHDAHMIVRHLNECNAVKGNKVRILGPAQPLVYRVQHVEIRHIFLKSETYAAIDALIKELKGITCSSDLFVTMGQ